MDRTLRVPALLTLAAVAQQGVEAYYWSDAQQLRQLAAPCGAVDE